MENSDKFLVIIAYFDMGNPFRRRNLAEVVKYWLGAMTECDVCISEQDSGSSYAKTLITDRVKYAVRQEASGIFNKTKLLNNAVRTNMGYKAYIMCDADALPDNDCIEYIRNNWNKASIVYPFSNAIYMNEYDTRLYVNGKPLSSGEKFHGAPIHRQTGLCNVFTYDTFAKINGFDEEFYRWGAEDDAFVVKCVRKVGPLLRNRNRGTIYHMFHPVVNTPMYLSSQDYVDNRKRCACIRRMSDDDFESYISGKVRLLDLVKKYEQLGRLEIELIWNCTPTSNLRIDTTIYDIPRDGEMTFTKILDVIRAEDDDTYCLSFIDTHLLAIGGLSEVQLNDIMSYRNMLCSSLKIQAHE